MTDADNSQDRNRTDNDGNTNDQEETSFYTAKSSLGLYVELPPNSWKSSKTHDDQTSKRSSDTNVSQAALRLNTEDKICTSSYNGNKKQCELKDTPDEQLNDKIISSENILSRNLHEQDSISQNDIVHEQPSKLSFVGMSGNQGQNILYGFQKYYKEDEHPPNMSMAENFRYAKTKKNFENIQTMPDQDFRSTTKQLSSRNPRYQEPAGQHNTQGSAVQPSHGPSGLQQSRHGIKPTNKYAAHQSTVTAVSLPHHGSTTLSSRSRDTSVLSEGAVCRICRESDGGEALISPCYCAGSLGLLHVSCLQTWLGASNNSVCEICHFQFSLHRKTQPLIKFLRDPGSARDRRNLRIDVVAFLIVTPLTLLTTWLCLAGAVRYYHKGGAEQGGLITLAVTTMLLYSIWITVCVRQNWHLWWEWRKYHQDVTLLCEPSQSRAQGSGTSSGGHNQVIQSIKFNVSQPPAKKSRSSSHSHGSSRSQGHGHQASGSSEPHQQDYTHGRSHTARMNNNVIQHTINNQPTSAANRDSANNCQNKSIKNFNVNKSLVTYVNKFHEIPLDDCRTRNSDEMKDSKCNTSKNVRNETDSERSKHGEYNTSSCAIFSRGNSPPEAGAARHVSSYTNVWLDRQSLVMDTAERSRCHLCVSGDAGQRSNCLCSHDGGRTERLI